MVSVYVNGLSVPRLSLNIIVTNFENSIVDFCEIFLVGDNTPIN